MTIVKKIALNPIQIVKKNIPQVDLKQMENCPDGMMTF
jgi:hypothetical protein